MSVADIVLIGIILGILALLTYLTRGKKTGGGCAGCHSDCSSCLGVRSFYDEYQADQKNERMMSDSPIGSKSSDSEKK